MKLTKAQRQQVFQMFGGRCAYCGCVLPERWHGDHIVPIYRGLPSVNGETLHGGRVRRGADDLSNIFPACPACNSFKGVYPLEAWRKEIALQVDRARRQSLNFRFAERFGLIRETGTPVRFYFETLRPTEDAKQEDGNGER